MAVNAFTDLVLAGIGVQPYSARGLTQTLTPISQAANLKRTANGALKDISFEGFRKYASTISGNDQLPPVCDGVWPGQTVTVDCIAELMRPTADTASRPVVEGSEAVHDAFTMYRPRLVMKVLTFNIQRDEYQRQVSWSMQLEEV